MLLDNFPTVLNYLYTRLPMFTRIGAAALKNDLSNTIAICEALGNPQNTFPSIHIAGTNGKGSTSSMLAAIFQQAGYKTGLYTSPHLKNFTERIRINGEEMSEQAVVDFVNTNRILIEKIEPSFFEVTVGMAFDYFAKQKVDIAIIEVGLGGRLDSTNIITPELSIITNISYDHTDLLGNTLAEISGEKAGIIKSHIPVIIGEKHLETTPVFLQKAKEMGVPIYFAEDYFFLKNIKSTLWEQRFDVEAVSNTLFFTESWGQISLDLTGKYQAHNLKTILLATEILAQKGWNLTQKVAKSALSQVKKITGLQGRMTILQEKPLVICDVGHNEAGIRFVIEQLQELSGGKQLHFVWGMVKDKNHNKVLSLLPKSAHYYFVCPNLPRGLPAQEMKILAADWNLLGNTHESVKNGLEAALSIANENDIIFVGGSTFVVAEVI